MAMLNFGGVCVFLAMMFHLFYVMFRLKSEMI